MNIDKCDALRVWLDDNPGKTKRDYLLEVRCPDDATRIAADYLLQTLDAASINYGLFVKVINYTRNYQTAPLNNLESVCFDIMIAPGIGRNTYLIEVDMPDNILGKQIENKRHECIPEEAFIWLLGRWCPDFDINSIDPRHRKELLWADMGGLLGMIGRRGFPNWKDKEFANRVVAIYERDNRALH